MHEPCEGLFPSNVISHDVIQLWKRHFPLTSPCDRGTFRSAPFASARLKYPNRSHPSHFLNFWTEWGNMGGLIGTRPQSSNLEPWLDSKLRQVALDATTSCTSLWLEMETYNHGGEALQHKPGGRLSHGLRSPRALGRLRSMPARPRLQPQHRHPSPPVPASSVSDGR